MKPAMTPATKARKPRGKTAQQHESVSALETLPTPPVSACENPYILIAQRAYELYSERGYRHGYALDDWLEAEREILSQILPA